MTEPAGNGWNRTVAVFAAALACALLVVSAGFAWQFGQLLGIESDDKRIWGAFGVTIILLKPVLTFVLKAAAGHGVARLGFGVLLSACVMYSSYATYSYRMAVRSETARQTETETDLRDRLKALGSPREATVLAPLLEKAKTHKAYRASDGCEADESTRDRTREHCRAYRDLEAELAASIAAENLRKRIEESHKGPVINERKLFGLSEMVVAAIVVAAILELSELLLLYGASILWGARPKISEPQSPPAEKPARKAATRRSAIQLWLEEQYLPSLPAGCEISAARVYDAYLAEWRERKKRPLRRLAFGERLNRFLLTRGAERRSEGGRLYYRLGALAKQKAGPAAR